MMKVYRIPCPGHDPLTLIMINKRLYIGELKPLATFAADVARAIQRKGKGKRKGKTPYPCAKCGRVFFDQHALAGHQGHGACHGAGKKR